MRPLRHRALLRAFGFALALALAFAFITRATASGTNRAGVASIHLRSRQQPGFVVSSRSQLPRASRRRHRTSTSRSKKQRNCVSMVQSLNLPGILAVAQVVRSPSLLLPHLAVQHIGSLDFEALKAAGIKGIVFDKDNTLTAPYVDTAHEAVAEALERSKRVFGAERLLILSNSAGTGDDPDFVAATRIEKGLGVPVLRHRTKKPGPIPEVLDYFRGVAGSDTAYRDLCIVGDRLLTDVMWGNGCGMLTVHTQILTEAGDNRVAAVVRRIEGRVGRVLRARGWEAPPHPFVAKYMEALKQQSKANRSGNGSSGAAGKQPPPPPQQTGEEL